MVTNILGVSESERHEKYLEILVVMGNLRNKCLEEGSRMEREIVIKGGEKGVDKSVRSSLSYLHYELF